MRLGRPSKPLEHYPDQLRFTPLTADPTSTVQGEAWLRSDLAPEDGQIATIRFDAGSSTWDIPVFETGTAIDTVEEVLRITVNGQLGYIPVAPENESAFSQLGFYHSSQRYGFHDRVEPGSAIPDVWTDNWPTDEGTGTTVSNDIGSNNITVDGAIWKDDVGRGGHYLAYNGSDDYSVSDSDANHFGVPTSSLACWFRPDSVGQGRGVVMGFPENSIQLEYDSNVSDGLSFIINDGADGGSSNIILNGPTVDAGEWVFAGVVIDESSGEAKLYSAFIEDSEVILSDSSSGYDNPSTFDVVSKMFVGGDGENDRRYFEGGVDDKYFASEGAASKSDFDETFSATADNYA